MRFVARYTACAGMHGLCILTCSTALQTINHRQRGFSHDSLTRLHRQLWDIASAMIQCVQHYLGLCLHATVHLLCEANKCDSVS